jgi:CheY-like chemotaxis protein
MPYRILVVDDDRIMAQFLADSLGVLGHDAIIAAGPRAALRSLSGSVPDVLFMDVNMPGIDGLELCRFLRREPTTATLPIIIVSAADDQSHREAAYRAGADFFIGKPAMIDDLDYALKRVVPRIGRVQPPGQTSPTLPNNLAE